VLRGARIIALNGRPVSHVNIVYNQLSIYGCVVKVASIGGVCTHPEYRGRGLASQLLDYCFREIAEAGGKLVYISGVRGLYRRAHAVPAGPVWTTHLRADTLLRGRREVVARQARPDDWPAVARLYQAEPVRFVRSAEFLSGIAAREGRFRSTWMIEVDGRPAAYLALSRLWGRARQEPVRELAEYAGARGALIAGLPALFEGAGLERIEFHVPAFDHELTHLLGCWGVDMRPGSIPGHTIRLLGLPNLMHSLRPYLLSRLPRADLRRLAFRQEGQTCSISLAEAAVDLDPSQAGLLVLGGPGRAELEGELGRVLASILPVPVPLPGFNYT
jgi:GNAT superfamily N-acetyltransferase